MGSLRLHALRHAAAVIIGLSAFGAVTAVSAQSRLGEGVLLRDAPMFLLPDATRTPLTMLPSGTVVRILAREGEWYRVVFRDSYFGNRTGYVEAANIRVRTAPDTAVPQPGAQGGTQPRGATDAPARRRPAGWADRGLLSVNALYQATANAFTSTTALTRYVETAQVTASYPDMRPPVVDVGVSGWSRRNVGVGVAFSWLSRKEDAAATGSIPHPFFFNAPRAVSGVASSVPREEIAIHGNVSWALPVGRSARVAVFGGPSYFRLKQGLVTDVDIAEAYPYDTATFVAATVENVSKWQVGYNAGVDLAVRIAGHAGVGALVRYSRASIDLPAGTGDPVRVRAGGWQAGGGIRLGF